MMTDYQCYRTMGWTSDSDECEADCGVVMSEERYYEGARGHFCSRKCAEESSYEGPDYREDFHSDG